MTLAQRIKEAMGVMSPADLARAAKVTPGAVTQWLDGTTKSLRAEKAAALEAATGFRATWIATGRGPKRIDEAEAPGFQLDALNPEERELLQNYRDMLADDQQEFFSEIAKRATKMREHMAKAMGWPAHPQQPAPLAVHERLTPEDQEYLKDVLHPTSKRPGAKRSR